MCKRRCFISAVFLCLLKLLPFETCLFSSFHIPCSWSTAVIPKTADKLWWRSSESWTDKSRQRLFLSNVLSGYWVKCLVVWSLAQNSYSHDASIQKRISERSKKKLFEGNQTLLNYKFKSRVSQTVAPTRHMTWLWTCTTGSTKIWCNLNFYGLFFNTDLFLVKKKCA